VYFLDSLLFAHSKRFGIIQWASNLVIVATILHMFICNHHSSLAMYKAYSMKEFLYLLLERMLEV
jgi:hypothetical protein